MAQQNTGYQGNPNLKKIGSNLDWTTEMVDEWMRCKDDPIYFTKKYIKIINLNDGLVNFIPYDYQEEILKTIHSNRYTIITTGRQSGKCFERNQRLTIKNKITGEIREVSGDQLFNIAKEEKYKIT